MAPNLHVSETHGYDETIPSANLLASSSQRDMSILQHISDTNNLYKTTQQGLDSGYEADDSGDSPAILNLCRKTTISSHHGRQTGMLITLLALTTFPIGAVLPAMIIHIADYPILSVTRVYHCPMHMLGHPPSLISLYAVDHVPQEQERLAKFSCLCGRASCHHSTS